MNERLRPALKELRQQFEQLYGPRLRQLVLFGSQARGDQEDDSDVDVLVVLDGPVRLGEEVARAGGIMASLSLQFTTVLSCLFISAERFAAEQSPLMLNVRREGILI